MIKLNIKIFRNFLFYLSKFVMPEDVFNLIEHCNALANGRRIRVCPLGAKSDDKQFQLFAQVK